VTEEYINCASARFTPTPEIWSDCQSQKNDFTEIIECKSRPIWQKPGSSTGSNM